MSGDPFPISTLPVPYEIVWCRFPHHDTFGNPGPYARPGLVRSTGAMPDGTGQVEVAYGTTKLKLHSRPFDLVISKMSEMDACGLFRATRFDLDYTIWLPWTTEWFEIRDDFFSPVIGKLTADGIRALQIAVSYKRKLQAARREKERTEPVLPLAAPDSPRSDADVGSTD